MQKHMCRYFFVLFCLIFISAAQAQNNTEVHTIDGQYIKEWLVLGPIFPDDLEKDFLVNAGGETNIEPKEGDTVVTAQGDTLTWRRYRTQSSVISIWDFVGDYEHAAGHGMKAGTMVVSMKSLFGTYDENSDIPHFFNKCSKIIKRMKLGNLHMAMLLVRFSGHKMIASSAGIPPM